MSHDEQTDILLSDYEQTAGNLCAGVNVSNETMQRYHGMTGRLLAQTVRSLWTQRELEATIDARVKQRCQDCVQSRATPPMQTPGHGWGDAARGLLAQNARLLVICGTVVICWALSQGQIRELVGALRELHAPAATTQTGR